MSAKISFPEPLRVPAELPLYATVRPAWDTKRVTELAACLGVRGAVVDAGNWFVVRDGMSTVEVYQASHSVRFGHDGFDAEGRGDCTGAVDRDRALAVAEQFHGLLGDIEGRAELLSVTELEVTMVARDQRAEERKVVGLQVNHGYTLHGLPLVGPGAKAQVTIGRDGELAQGYRFWRDVTRKGSLRTLAPQEAFERFAGSGQFADLPRSARVTVASVQLGLLCLPPTEVQGVLLPAYVLRGEVHTEMLPRYEFIVYVAAGELDDTEAKRNRWSPARPSLMIA